MFEESQVLGVGLGRGGERERENKVRLERCQDPQDTVRFYVA